MAMRHRLGALVCLWGLAGTAQAQLPSLPQLFAQALAHDAGLTRQRYEFEATRQEVGKAWAGLRPQVEASYSHVYQDSSNIYTENPENYAQNDLYDERVDGEIGEDVWRVQLSQPLFSLERWRQVDKAKAQVSAAELNLALAERDLALDVSQAYLDAYLASQTLALLESKREALALQRRQAQRAYDLGVGDRINLLEAQARFDQAEADQYEVENELANALSTLERLTGSTPEFARIAVSNVQAIEVARLQGDRDAWLARIADNLQVRLAEQQLQVVQADTAIRRAGHYPQVNLNLGYTDRNSPDELRASEDAQASVEVRVPLYRGGYTQANVRQGELYAQAGEAEVTEASELARQEVRQRLRGLESKARRLDALKRSLASAMLYLEAADKGEQLGLRDLVDVLDARADLYDLRIEFVEVIGQWLADKLALEAAVGDLETRDLDAAMALLDKLSAA
ncbi:TolC family protein [Modicisalibacter xianhensis]|uniref:Outer membrane protein n=1 Tax=Modicisalibacter xianhensis TaxID=442341 RepID=A0A1I2ZF92_9GAMM|nr:TolC family protein [Halomonas xianhensis]SFH36523.1 outer membrane protein [Halomonas xianhensis]